MGNKVYNYGLLVCHSITGFVSSNSSCSANAPRWFIEEVEDGLDIKSDLRSDPSEESDSKQLHHEFTATQTEFASNGEPSQLDEFLNELSSLVEIPQLSELQYSVYFAHSTNDTELHSPVTLNLCIKGLSIHRL